MILNAEPFAITGIVVTEVLQGAKRDINLIERDLLRWEMLEPLGFRTYSQAASLFRLARSHGIALATTDALIAAIALENNARVFTLDKDFTRIAVLVNLQLYSA